MAQRGSRRGKNKSDQAVKADHFGGTARILQSRFHARLRAATLSPGAMLRTVLLIVLGLLCLIFIGLWLGGHLPTVRQDLRDFKQGRLMAMGFTVERIDVMGEGRLNEADVRAAIGIYQGDYFFGADLKRAQERTESLPWVDRAVVRRLWPNRIVVQLVETTPYALSQQDGLLFLISQDGRQIAPLSEETSRLPDGLRVFTGEEAAENAQNISIKLETIPALWSRTRSLTRHASGRWDVRLVNGTILRLPLGEEVRAFRQYQALQAQTDLERQYAIIDMRLSDRLTLTPRDDGQA